MFSPTNLFKKIDCPEGLSCRLPNCIFTHELPQIEETKEKNALDGHNDFEDRRDIKRRKLENGVVGGQAANGPAFTGTLNSTNVSIASTIATSDNRLSQSAPHKTSPNGFSSLQKEVSPPPLRNSTKSTILKSKVKSNKPEAPISLNPRLLQNNPAPHDKRRLYLTKMYENMVRLNQAAESSNDALYQQFVLSTNGLKQLALDEEEQYARENLAVYANMIKHRLLALQRMTLDDWIKQRSESQPEVKVGEDKKHDEKRFPLYKSDLTTEEERLLLQRLIVNQTPLAQYGYTIEPLSEDEIIKSRAGVAAADNWENCSRCGTRFQVFPDRRESDGVLTTNGPCLHHPSKAQVPPKDPMNKTQTDSVERHACCGAVRGTEGCTKSESHVFTVKSPARLASILAFEQTPVEEAGKVEWVWKLDAVSFDCEMAYTVYGLELVRLTAMAWPSGKQLLDILVRPMGTILDFNSRFSGVWPEDFANAVPYDGDLPPPADFGKLDEDKQESDAKPKRSIPPIVPSIAVARKLLMSILTPATPLIGHAIENDLNSVRLIHPTIIDTVIRFPHPRGMPYRLPLRALAKKYLGWTIQTGGSLGKDEGHDSKEDAMATGELVRVAAEREWKALKAQGWKLEGGKLVYAKKRN
ncbi:MAG: RNA exonuclease 3 [Bogoriella megaspora]|nr:MAG: RNA exonuclease 3 [Bogoriella megaspora]